MKEEELQKRFTDCVYFLASPLTCKKGIECEYRHSEIARLNPRDCWYWFGGNCLNPDCAFRHPGSIGSWDTKIDYVRTQPLEAYKEAFSESVDHHHGPVLPVNKKNTPCYFYLNGFCNKHDRCSFMHGPNDGTHAWRSSTAASTVKNAVLSEKKLTAGNNIGSIPSESHPHPSETTQFKHVYTESKPKQDSEQLPPSSAETIESSDIPAIQCEDSVSGPESLLHAEEFVQSESDVLTDQSTDVLDVLVEGISENVEYETDSDYFPVHDENGRELNGHYVGYDYDYEDPIKYNRSYSELGNRHKQEKDDAYDRLDDRQACDYLSKITGKSRESIFHRLSSQKVEQIFDRRRGPDRHDRLKKRKVADDHFSRRHKSPCMVVHRIRRSPQRYVSRHENHTHHRGRFGKAAPVNRSRLPFKKPNRKMQFLSSEVSRSRNQVEQEKRSQEQSAIFTGPKTLDQIKEAKKNPQQNGDLPGSWGPFSKTASCDLQGPRPLNAL